MALGKQGVVVNTEWEMALRKQAVVLKTDGKWR